MNWQLWFLKLSGWPALLTIIVIVGAFMLLASVVLTKLGSRSVVQAMVLTASALTVLALIVLFALAWLTRKG